MAEEKTKARKTRPKAADNVNTRLYDDAVLRQANLLVYREGLVRRFIKRFYEVDGGSLDRIAAVLSQMSALDIGRLGSAANLSRSTQRTRAFVEAMRQFAAVTRDAAREAIPELRTLAFDEAGFWAARIQHHLPQGLDVTINTPQKAKLAEQWANTLILGESINQMIDRWSRQRAEALALVIRRQYAEGSETGAVIRGLGGKHGILARQVDGTPSALGDKLRTAVAGSVEIGHAALVAENDLLNDLVWTSVLDSRTSDVCRIRHGKLVNKELGGRLPPAHPRCLPQHELAAPVGEMRAVFSRWYSGQVINIGFAGEDAQVALTLNHPVLTPDGWMPAGLVSVGATLLTWPAPERRPIGEWRRSVQLRWTEQERPGSAHDFHGDGMAGVKVSIWTPEGYFPTPHDPAATLQAVRQNIPGVIASEVTYAAKSRYTGPVCDMETSSGVFCAGAMGLVVHNCRSITVPGIYNIRRARELQKSLPKDSTDIAGRIPEHETASAWLARQDREMQLKVLGPGRLRLYETGKYRWPEDFFRDTNGTMWTLEQLRQRSQP